jgi:uncharacterized protein (TIRG00374 family)
MRRYKTFIRIGGHLLSAFFLYLLFRNTDFKLVFENFRYVHGYYIVAAASLHALFILLRGLYQRNNLRFLKNRIDFTHSTTSVSLAVFYNVIFPARIGEVIRSLYLAEKEGLARGAVFSYVLIEKIIDFFFMLVLLVVIALLGFHNQEVFSVLTVTAAVVVFICTVIFLFVRYTQRIETILKRVFPQRFHRKIETLVRSLVDGLTCFRSVKQISVSMTLMAGSWLLMAGVFWLTSVPYLRLIGLPFYACFFFLVFSALALAVPSGPAGIGIVHYGYLLAIKIMTGPDFDINLAASFILVLHFFTGVVYDLALGGCYILIGKSVKREVLHLGNDLELARNDTSQNPHF